MRDRLAALVAPLVAIAAAALAVAGLAGAMVGDPDPGVMPALPGDLVLSVSPAGYAWRDGVRPGQLVVAIVDATEAGGWRLETTDGTRSFVTSAVRQQAALRESLPIAGGAVLAAGVSLVGLRRHRAAAIVAAAVAAALAGFPLSNLGDPALSTVALGFAFILPTSWLASRRLLRPTAAAILVVGLAAFLAAWAAGRASAADWYDSLEAIRGPVTFVAVQAAFVVVAIRPLAAREWLGTGRLRFVDIASGAVAAAAATTLIFVVEVSPYLVALLLLATIAIYPAWRQTAAEGVDRLVLAGLRERAVIEASEEERARLAHELHDVPLQQLAGIIHHLETVSGAGADASALREVAGHLRAVATGLRPPMLDDLGLVPALEFLAEQASTPALEVHCEVRVAPATATGRPPLGIELAGFRIAQEAVGNAIRHSGASDLWIRGTVTAERVELLVEDDGRGLSAREAELASRRGRLGLVSMRRRAATVGADLWIDVDDGTTVRFRWPE